MSKEEDAALRARLNEELGFYPASLDPESIAEYRRRAAGEANGIVRRTRVVEKQYDQDEIEARKKKYTRGWIVEPEEPNPGISAGEEIERWYTVIGVRGRAA